MRVLNKTQNTVISDNAKLLTNLAAKSLGLLAFPQDQSLIFKTRFGIHTFFLKNSIDVLILDHEKRVRKIRNSLKPWRLFFWNPQFVLVIELKEGSIIKSKTKFNDIIELES